MPMSACGHVRGFSERGGPTRWPTYAHLTLTAAGADARCGPTGAPRVGPEHRNEGFASERGDGLGVIRLDDSVRREQQGQRHPRDGFGRAVDADRVDGAALLPLPETVGDQR